MPKILVVEDDGPILDLMELLLHRLGYDPVLHSNGPDALEYVKKEAPALILLDIMMTPISGWEVLERLRADPAFVQVPVIIFSASPSVEERMASLHDPCLGVLHKPVSLAELRNGIEKFIGKP